MEMVEEKPEILEESSVFAQNHQLTDQGTDQQQISNSGLDQQNDMNSGLQNDMNSQDQSYQQQTDQYQSTFQDDSVKQEISNQEEGISMEMVQEPSQQEIASMDMVEAGVGAIDPLLIKEQFNWLKATIRVMKKKKDAHIFLVPVNPVALNIPSYFTIIKEPMDISTVEQKIAHGQYQNVSRP